MGKRLDDNGHEVLDDTPLTIPVKFRRPETLIESVQRLVAGEMSRIAEKFERESFDEADDFDVGDDYDPRSPHELDDGQIDYDIRHDERYKRVEKAEGKISGDEGGSEAGEGVVDAGGGGSPEGIQPVGVPPKGKSKKTAKS